MLLGDEHSNSYAAQYSASHPQSAALAVQQTMCWNCKLLGKPAVLSESTPCLALDCLAKSTAAVAAEQASCQHPKVMQTLEVKTLAALLGTYQNRVYLLVAWHCLAAHKAWCLKDTVGHNQILSCLSTCVACSLTVHPDLMVQELPGMARASGTPRAMERIRLT